MLWNQLANQIVGLTNLNIKDPLIVQHLSLNHLTMMNSNNEKYSVSYLTEQELNNLVLKAISMIEDEEEPHQYIHSVSNKEVS